MAITTRNDVFQNKGKGYGVAFLGPTLGTATATTAAAAGSGYFTTQLFFNTIGTTVPTTQIGFPLPAGLPKSTFQMMGVRESGTSTFALWLAYVYKLGTLVLTATGDQFTHDAATFPVLRTVYGAASTAISLVPLAYITTATATSAPVFRLRTAAGASGYTDQDGNSVIGTRTMTMPAAATAINSCFVVRLEEGDAAVQDITAIEVTNAGSAGAADIWGAELLMPFPHFTAIGLTGADTLFAGLQTANLDPAVATSGTATAKLCLLTIGTTGNNISQHIYFAGVVNN